MMCYGSEQSKHCTFNHSSRSESLGRDCGIFPQKSKTGQNVNKCQSSRALSWHFPWKEETALSPIAGLTAILTLKINLVFELEEALQEMMVKNIDNRSKEEYSYNPLFLIARSTYCYVNLYGVA